MTYRAAQVRMTKREEQVTDRIGAYALLAPPGAGVILACPLLVDGGAHFL